MSRESFSHIPLPPRRLTSKVKRMANGPVQFLFLLMGIIFSGMGSLLCVVFLLTFIELDFSKGIPIGDLMAILGPGIFIFVGLVLIVIAKKMGGRGLEVLRNGELVEAYVVDRKRDYSIKVNGVPAMAWQLKSSLGEFRLRRFDEGLMDELKKGDRIWIIVDSNTPDIVFLAKDYPKEENGFASF